MLERVLRHLRNWFIAPGGVQRGTFTIADGTLELPFLIPGQHFRIKGSILNDGVYLYPAVLADETFSGEIWPLAIPKALLETVADIEAWQATNGKAADGPYTSESFGGYSYTKATDSKTGGAVTWESAFRGRLNIWRKV